MNVLPLFPDAVLVQQYIAAAYPCITRYNPVIFLSNGRKHLWFLHHWVNGAINSARLYLRHHTTLNRDTASLCSDQWVQGVAAATAIET